MPRKRNGGEKPGTGAGVVMAVGLGLLVAAATIGGAPATVSARRGARSLRCSGVMVSLAR